MATWRNTSFTEEQPTSPNEKWSTSNTSITRNLILSDGQYTTRVQAAYDILGYAVVSPNNQIVRVTPMYYPAPTTIAAPPDVDVQGQIPSLSKKLYAVQISRTQQRGVGGTSRAVDAPNLSAAAYSKSVITTEFSTLPYQILTDAQIIGAGYTTGGGGPDEGAALKAGWVNSRYIIRHFTPFSRIIKVPYGILWNIGGPGWTNINNLPKNTKTALPKREGGAVVEYTWVKVPISYVNMTKIGSALGTINPSAFDFAKANTLLLDHVDTREYEGPFGERYMDVKFTMIWLPHPSTGNNAPGGPGTGLGTAAGTHMGWNYIYDVVNGLDDYYLVSSGTKAGPLTNSTLPFKALVDFGTLFSP